MVYHDQDLLTLRHIEKLAERFAMSNQDAAKFTLWSKQMPHLADKPLQQRIAKFREVHPVLWQDTPILDAD
ncbi:MAG: hypothetical protein B7Z75_05545 [Acidocella sp. 20-57-95]|nr:MAG: hypothetical protein B7Z75_05545 [Acidocella sp. 20-57-95]HQT64591.1 hypothetical protein [Acidocella sp.]